MSKNDSKSKGVDPKQVIDGNAHDAKDERRLIDWMAAATPGAQKQAIKDTITQRQEDFFKKCRKIANQENK